MAIDLTKYKTSQTSIDLEKYKLPQIQEIPTQSLSDKIWADLTQRGENVYSQLTSSENPIVSGVKATAQAFGGIGDIAGEILGATPIVGDISKSISGLAQKGFSKVVNYASPIGEKLLQLEQTNPKTAKVITNFLETAAATGDISGNILTAEAGKLGLQKAAKIPASIGKSLQTLGEKSVGIGIPTTPATGIALQAYEAQQPTFFGRIKNFITGEEKVGTKPITEANTATRQGLMGTEWKLGVQAKRISENLWNEAIKPALEENNITINKSDFFSTIRKRLISENPDLSRRKSLLNAFDAFAEDYKKVNNFSLPKLQDYKAGWAKFVPERAYKGQPIAGALNDVRNIAAQEARKIIYNAVGENIKTAYFDYGNLQSIAEAGIKTLDQLRSRSWSRQVWEALMDKGVTPVTTIGGQILYRLGGGLKYIEFVGPPGATKLRDLLKFSSVAGVSQTMNQE